jgi:hypothetical protein
MAFVGCCGKAARSPFARTRENGISVCNAYRCRGRCPHAVYGKKPRASQGEGAFFDYRTMALVALVVAVWAGLDRIRRELSARILLRDGEITIGYITDWISGGHSGPRVTYLFWTSTGKRFEHERPVVSDKDIFSEKAIVPVFYMPEDPTRSIALCCARSRVKLPGERFARIGKKNYARS